MENLYRHVILFTELSSMEIREWGKGFGETKNTDNTVADDGENVDEES